MKERLYLSCPPGTKQHESEEARTQHRLRAAPQYNSSQLQMHSKFWYGFAEWQAAASHRVSIVVVRVSYYCLYSTRKSYFVQKGAFSQNIGRKTSLERHG